MARELPPRILFGLDRLPASLDPGDPRLPGVEPGPGKLRLNSVPVPAEFWPAGMDHAARRAAFRGWILEHCGDYNEALRRAVGRYLDAVAAHVAAHREELAQGLARYEGLFAVEDWVWSALRPLPRAWWRTGDTWSRAPVAFWDGRDVIAMTPGDLDAAALPPSLEKFWRGQVLPVSPFRRADAQSVISSM